MGKINIVVIILFLILLAFHGLNNYFVLTKSTYCLRPDNVTYLERTTHIFRTLKEFKLNPNYLRGVYITVFRDPFKPPLFFITGIPFILFGINKDILAMSNLVYLGVLLFATYGIGKTVFNSRAVGLFSAFFVSCFPAIFPFSRVLMVDFALISMVTLSAYLFLLGKFDSLKFSLLAGLIVGLSALTKQTYLVFFPAILTLFFLKKDNLQEKRNIRNLIISLSLAFVIAANFYILNFSENLKYLSFNVAKLAYREPAFYYLTAPLKNKLFLVLSAPFLISLVYLCKERKFGLPVLILFPLLLCSILNNKLERFILPIIPFVIISTTGILWLFVKIRRPLFSILSAFVILLYLLVSYQGVLPIRRDFAKKFLFGSDYYNIEQQGFVTIINEGDWEAPAREIVSSLAQGHKREGRILVIGQRYETWTSIQYETLVRGLTFELRKTALDTDFLYQPQVINMDFDDEVRRSDFIAIERKGEIGDKGMHIGRLTDAFKRNSDKFKLIKTINLPYNLSCDLYKNFGGAVKTYNY